MTDEREQVKAEETGKETKVLKLKKQKGTVPFVFVLFCFVVLYLIIQGIIVLARKSVQIYNVGPVSSDNVSTEHLGIVLRNEKVVRADSDAYVNYYVISGDWVSDKRLICSVDGDGNVQAKLMTLFAGHSVLSDNERARIQAALRNIVETYDGLNFETAIRGKGEASAAILGILMSEIENPDEKLKGLDYTPVYARESGFVMEWVDGMEERTVQSLTAADFEPGNHEKVLLQNGEKVTTGGALYKFAPDNAFELAFLLTEKELASYGSRKTLSIRTESGLEITGEFRVETSSDGKAVGVLSFKKYGGNFVSERHERFRILDKSVSGFKVPESALVTKSFFVVPADYITMGGGSNQKGVFAEVNGRYQFIAATVYEKSEVSGVDSLVTEDGVAFVMSPELKAGMKITIPGREENVTTLARMTPVEGCYQVNNGYCIFKPVKRIQNSIDSSYVMISSRLSGTIRAYDRVVLDASKIRENQIIFE